MAFSPAEERLLRKLIGSGPLAPQQVAALRRLGTGVLDALPGNTVLANGGGMLPGLIGRFTTPADVTISSNTTLATRINYFATLTVNASITLTGLAGGTVIICETALVNAGTISANALGGRSAGYGGGAWGRGKQPVIRTSGGFISDAALGATVAYDLAPTVQQHMASGGSTVNGAAGSAGGAWPFTTGAPIDALRGEPIDYLLLLALWDLLQQGQGNDNATTGAIGGGGGGGNGLGGTAGRAGGRGGGVLLIICKALNNTGTISANGANGTAGSGASTGGGGGGGGGGVVVAYETLTAAGTIQASGGSGGAAGAGGAAGGAGGAGAAASFNIRSGD